MRELTKFGKATLLDRYVLKDETIDQMFERVARAYSSGVDHYERMLSYMKKFWFMPSTPILSNAGTNRGLPISCYLNKVEDSLESIANKWEENVFIAAKGGGIGTDWSNVRALGESITDRGNSSGIIPFIRVTDSLALAISQGSLRRGSAACYLSIDHPEIEEFIEIRKPTGDFNRKSLNIHHGIVISDKFMECVVDGKDWDLVAVKTKEVVKTVNARELFQKILETRIATGEPYLLFIDTVNNNRPIHHKKLNLYVSQSNLCSEIVLPTGEDHYGRDRTAVCCLGSVNAEYYDEWEGDTLFIEDCLRYLDNVLHNFKEMTANFEHLASAHYSVSRENSVGLGVMGFHSYLQRKRIAFESLGAKVFNTQLFRRIHEAVGLANRKLADELGACLDAWQVGEKLRFSYAIAIAPTASISIIAGGTSPCIEPLNANIFTQKTLSGSFEVKNKYLVDMLEEIGQNNTAVWDSIVENSGSVQHLDFLNENQKLIFKTAFEIDQRWLIEFAADRSMFIDQSQSINLFLASDVDKYTLLMLHISAWRKGVKSLYYLRSRALQRAGFVGGVESDNKLEREKILANATEKLDFEECLVCQ